MRAAIFLDRDGVLNEPVVRNGKPYPPRSAHEVQLCEGAVTALEQLREASFLLVCITNQPDIARGTTSMEQLDTINRVLTTALPLDDLLVCPHDDADGCLCRKPKPGMIFEAARRHGINVGRSYLVGDRWRDIDAGTAAGCRTVLVDRTYEERAPSTAPDHRAVGIADAAAWILADARRIS